MLGALGRGIVGWWMQNLHWTPLLLIACAGPSDDIVGDSAASDVTDAPLDDREPVLRTRLRFTTDWSVFQGTPDGTPWAKSYDASAWRPTTLPHGSTLIDGEPDPARTCYPDYSYEGSTWYRRTFDVPASYAGQELSLEFEAAGTVATVWLNGTEVLTHKGGYLPFVVELDESTMMIVAA